MSIIKPNAGIFRRWSIVALVLSIFLIAMGSIPVYLHTKYNEYKYVESVADDSWSDLYDTYRTQFEAIDRAEQACIESGTEEPDETNCPETSTHVSTIWGSKEAEFYLIVRDHAAELEWAETFDNRDNSMYAVIVIGVGATLFGIWLLTFVVRFIYWGGKMQERPITPD